MYKNANKLIFKKGDITKEFNRRDYIREEDIVR